MGIERVSPPLEVRGGWEGLSFPVFPFTSVKNSSARVEKGKLKAPKIKDP
jgi:hypothetical protein